MKIRIKGNSLRLRLTQSEVETFASEGLVSDSIDFGEQKLIYSLQQVKDTTITAQFNGEFITVQIPGPQAKTWADTDEVSMESVMNTAGENLHILVEKDFQCLKSRPGEDESDLFKNPLA